MIEDIGLWLLVSGIICVSIIFFMAVVKLNNRILKTRRELEELGRLKREMEKKK